MNTELIADYEADLKNLVGQPCWSAQVSGVGSLVSFHFGAKLKRDQPMTHPDFKITDEERLYRGEFILYIEDCPWRIETTEAVIATWMDESTPGSPIDAGMRQFVGQRVAQVELVRPGLDLTLHFENGLRLRIFPDQIDADVGDNYSLALPDHTYVVAARSTLYLDTP
jgi:hypothetical protein